MRTPEETLAQLDEIEVRARRAAASPWFLHHGGFDADGLHVMSSEFDDAVLASFGGDIPDPAREDSAIFIAAAREDVPDLVALVRQLLAQLDAAAAATIAQDLRCERCDTPVDSLSLRESAGCVARDWRAEALSLRERVAKASKS